MGNLLAKSPASLLVEHSCLEFYLSQWARQKNVRMFSVKIFCAKISREFSSRSRLYPRLKEAWKEKAERKRETLSYKTPKRTPAKEKEVYPSRNAMSEAPEHWNGEGECVRVSWRTLESKRGGPIITYQHFRMRICRLTQECFLMLLAEICSCCAKSKNYECIRIGKSDL